MPVKKYKPTSPGRRFQDVLLRDEITADRPEKSLTKGISKSGGRNNRGRITTYQRGGGHKRRYRVVDFRREKTGVPGKVRSIEYDPNRSARVALIVYMDGEKRYIIAPNGLEVGRDHQFRTGCGDPNRQRAARGADSAGHHVSQHRNEAWARRTNRPQCRRERPTHGEGGELRAVSTILRRGAHDSPFMLRHDWRGGKLRPQQCEPRQGGAQALAGSSTQRARCGHEPGGSPSGRWRGKEFGRKASGDPVGQADQRIQDAQER